MDLSGAAGCLVVVGVASRWCRPCWCQRRSRHVVFCCFLFLSRDFAWSSLLSWFVTVNDVAVVGVVVVVLFFSVGLFCRRRWWWG